MPVWPPLRAIALAATLAAALTIVAATYAALWTPGAPDLTVARDGAGRERVAWVAPDGPAALIGAQAGDTAAGRRTGAGGAPVLLVRHGGRTLAPAARRTRPRARGRDRRARNAFWAMCTAAGLALGMMAAATHGLRPALAAQFVALRLFGPAFLALTLALPVASTADPPVDRAGGRRRAPLRTPRLSLLLWLPAVIVLPMYIPLEARPDTFAALGQALADVALLGYMAAACARVGVLAPRRRALSAAGRAQLRLLELGLVGGFAPFLALSLVPRLLTGAELAPARVAILALALLPLAVGAAIVRTEFPGITALVHRRTLRLLVGLALLGLVAALTWAVTTAGLPMPLAAVATSVAAALAFAPARRLVSRAASCPAPPSAPSCATPTTRAARSSG